MSWYQKEDVLQLNGKGILHWIDLTFYPLPWVRIRRPLSDGLDTFPFDYSLC